jgi:SnoaL-like domain
MDASFTACSLPRLLPGEAASRVICFNPMVLPFDKEQAMFCGLWCDDEFRRTPDGWRMSRWVETKCFQKILCAPVGRISA